MFGLGSTQHVSSSTVETDKPIAGRAFEEIIACDGYTIHEQRVAKVGCDNCLRNARTNHAQCKIDVARKHCDIECDTEYEEQLALCDYIYEDYVHDCEAGWSIPCMSGACST